jgi:hypothetical protein
MRYSDLAGQLAAAHGDCDESENEARVVVEVAGEERREPRAWKVTAVGICNGGRDLYGRKQDEIIIEVEDESSTLREENAEMRRRVRELERTIETMMGLRDGAVND